MMQRKLAIKVCNKCCDTIHEIPVDRHISKQVCSTPFFLLTYQVQRPMKDKLEKAAAARDAEIDGVK